MSEYTELLASHLSQACRLGAAWGQRRFGAELDESGWDDVALDLVKAGALDAWRLLKLRQQSMSRWGRLRRRCLEPGCCRRAGLFWCPRHTRDFEAMLERGLSVEAALGEPELARQ